MNVYWTPDELKIIQYWNQSTKNGERRKMDVELWQKIKKQKQNGKQIFNTQTKDKKQL